MGPSRIGGIARVLALLLIVSVLSYGIATAHDAPADAAPVRVALASSVPPPATSDPATTNKELKTCPTAICVGPSRQILKSKVPVDPADQAGVASLQANAEEVLAGIHGLDADDERTQDWAQPQIAGLMWTRMLHVIETHGTEDHSPEGDAIYHWFQKVVQQYTVESAAKASQEYENWKSAQCDFEPAAPSPATPAYESGLGCHQLDDDNDPIVGLVAAGARLPTFEQLQAWGSYEASQSLGAPTSTIKDLGSAVLYSATISAAIVASAGVATAVSFGLKIGQISRFINSPTYQAFEKYTKLAKTSAKAAERSAKIGRAFAGRIADATLFGVLVPVMAAFTVVLAITTIILGIVVQVQAAELPVKLRKAIDDAQSTLPDLKGMLANESNQGGGLLFSLFAAQLDIGSLTKTLGGAAISQPNWHGDQLSSQSFATDGGAPTPVGSPVSSKAVSVKTWSKAWDDATAGREIGDAPPPVTWLTDQGWFQQSADGGSSWTTDLQLRYLDWAGKERAALIQQDHFVDVAADADFDPATCTDEAVCRSTNTLRMLDANGTAIEVTLDAAAPVDATITDDAAGSYVAGETTTFTAPATGPGVTYTWQIESRCGVVALCVPPFDQKTGTYDPAFHGSPAVTRIGRTVENTWPSAGTYHVRLTTSNAAGTRVSDQDVTVTQGPAPVIRFGRANLGPLIGPGTVTLTGCIDTASSLDKPTVTIDWGDGTHDTAVPPAYTIVTDGVVRPTGQPFLVQAGAPSGGGCTGSWSFAAEHAYATAPPAGFPVSVKALTPTTGQESTAQAGTARFLPSTLDADFAVTNHGGRLDPNGFPAFDEGQSVNLRATFNADPAAYGASVEIDWGQFGVHTSFFSSCGVDGCTIDQTLDASHTYYTKPGFNPNSESVFTPTLTVRGADGSITFQKTAKVAVFNVRPIISNLTFSPTTTIGGFPAAPEGRAVTLTGTVTTANPTTPIAIKVAWPGDPDGRTDTINLPPSSNANRTFTSTHTYRSYDDFVRSVTVDAYDQAGGQDIKTANLFITNVAPSPSSSPAAVDQGAPVTLGVATGDPGWFDHFTQTIDWGDGTAPQTSDPSTAPNGTLQTPPHTYGAPGTYDVSIGVDDGDGGSGSASTTVTVGNVKPVVRLTPATGTRGSALTLTGSIVDAAGDDPFTATVDWRDGSDPQEVTGLPGGALSLTHTYAQGGVFPVQVTVADEHHAESDPVTGLITVDGPPVFKANDPGDHAVGDTVGYQFAARGFPLPTFELADGTLPPGLTLGSDGFLSGTPTQRGTYTFKVRASNTSGAQTAGPITMAIARGPNTAPTGADQSGLATAVGQDLEIDLANADVDGDDLTCSIVDEPGAGTVALSGDAPSTDCTATFTPAGVGDTSFTYRVSDGDLTSDTHTISVSVGKAAQTITFPEFPSVLGTRVTLGATASSSLPVTYAITGPGCTALDGAKVTFGSTVGATCKVTASQAGDATHLAAPSASRSIKVARVPQAIAFDQPSGTFGVAGSGTDRDTSLTLTVDDVSVTLPDGSPSPLPPQIATSGEACARTAPTELTAAHPITITFTAGGTCSITATQPGDLARTAATAVTRKVSVGRSAQAIAFDEPTGPFGVAGTGTADPTSLTLTADDAHATEPDGTASPLPVEVSTSGNGCAESAPTAVTAVHPVTITFTAGGVCWITARQLGDGRYAPARSVTRRVTVTRTAQVIAFQQPAGPFGVAGSGTTRATSLILTVDDVRASRPDGAASPLPVQLSTSGDACLKTPQTDLTATHPITINFIAGGTCWITARQPGDRRYAQAGSVTRKVPVSKTS